MSYRVACVECRSYDPEAVRAAVDRAVALVGPVDDLVGPGDRVLMKINHLGAYPADAAIGTHPEIVAAVAAALRRRTDRLALGDGLTQPGNDEFRASGTAQMASRHGIELVNFFGGDYVGISLPGPGKLKSVPIAKPVIEADVNVTLPKLKTHVLTLLTGAVKNAYGYLPKRARENYHRSYIVPREFAEAVVDIYRAVVPKLVVMDAVVGLEGYGPASKGTPRPIGCILAGRNAVAVDCVAARLIGLRPDDVDTLVAASRRGLGPARMADIELLGDDVERFVVPDYDKPETAMRATAVINRLPDPVARLLTQITEHTRGVPLASADLCTSCGRCAAHCPVHAIRFENGRAIMDYSTCIRCFCCQEFCPEGAIDVDHGTWGRVWGWAKWVVKGLRGTLRRLNE